MVLTKSPLKKHKVSEVPNLKDEGPTLNELRKPNIVKKAKSPDKIINKQKDAKAKPNNKAVKILKSASVTKKIVEQSKIPVPLSKSSTYKQITVQHKKTVIPRKKIASPRSSKEQPSNSSPSNKADLKFVMLPKDKSFMKLDKMYQSDVASRVKQLKKHDAENLKRIKNQYFSSVLSDIRKSDFEATLRKYADNDKNVSTELKKKKKKSIKKKPPPKIIHITPQILSDNNENNEYGSINSLRKDSPSLTTQFLDIDSQTSQIPITKRFKTVKPKKSPREKLTTDGKDVKSTQLTQHKKKSKTHTMKQNNVQSSDSVPNLPIREIKHNDSFVLSAKKFNSSMKRASARHKKSPVHLKLKTKRPKSTAHQAVKSGEVKNDSTKPEKLKSCLKKTWDENDFSAVQNKYEMNFGLVPLIVN